MRRLVACGDNHGDLRNAKACKRVIEFCKDFKPDCRVHLGDNWDFRWLRKSASKDEQEQNITDDLNAGIEFISAFKPTVFLRGNHDQRVYDRAETSVGHMAALCHHVIERMETALNGCLHVGPYGKRRLWESGGWRFGHGWGSGINAVRDQALRYGNLCMGHLHRVERVPAARYERAVGLCAGCLCELDLDYNRSQLGTLAQEQGFVWGEMRNGVWRLQQEVI